MYIYIHCAPRFTKETKPDRLWPSRIPPRTNKNQRNQCPNCILTIKAGENKTKQKNQT